jgi:hypothetical protein
LAGWRLWFTPILLITEETEIRRIVIRSQPRQIIHKTLSLKRAGEVAQGVHSEFKPQHHKKIKIKK